MRSKPLVPTRSVMSGSLPKEATTTEKKLSQIQAPTKENKMDVAIRRELRRKNLCFTCKNPWEPNHKCMGKGQIYYIDVVLDENSDIELDLGDIDLV